MELFLVSRQLAQLASQNAIVSQLPVLSNLNPMFTVPLRQRSTFLAASQWTIPGFVRKRDKIDREADSSGRVETISYIREPVTNR